MKRDQADAAVLAEILEHTDEALCQRVDEGAVLLHFQTGSYYEVDAVGLLIWDALDGSSSGAAVAEFVARRYGIGDEAACADTAAFLRELTRACLVRPSGAALTRS